MQALLKIGLTIRTQGQCAEGGGMLSAPGGAVKAQIAQNSRSGRDPCSDTTKTAAKSKSPRLRLWRARPDAWERWVARPSSVPAQEIFNIALFSLFVCCGILASFKSKISRFAWLFWPDRWHPKFPLICGKIFTQPEIWYEFSFDNHNLLVKGKLWSLFDINVKIEVRRYWWIEEKSSSVSKSNPETEAPCLSSVFRRPFYIIKVF